MRTVRSYGTRVRSPFVTVGESMTEQAHKSHVDVNTIVQKFRQTGVMPKGREGAYGDVTGLQKDLREQFEVSGELSERLAEYIETREKELQTAQEKEKAELEELRKAKKEAAPKESE